jgi:alanine-glyoxylate transaminase / (R)-3-amino-2-methylpropionate-pyruvate transaminase
LVDLQQKHELIGDVRGLGLMLGVELVRNRKSKEPANTDAADVMEKMKERNVLIGKGGLFGNTLRIKPPMCINKDDADYMIAMLDEVLTEISRK